MELKKFIGKKQNVLESGVEKDDGINFWIIFGLKKEFSFKLRDLKTIYEINYI